MRLKRLGLSLLVLLLVFAGVVHWRASAREAAARAAYPPEGQVLEVNGRTVHAVQMGSGPDLVMIHGSGGNTRDFTFALAPKLAERYRVTVIDRPGLGWSERLPKGAESINDQAAQMKAAADALGVSDPLVLGQSYGGAVALAWATDFQDETAGIITLAGVSHGWDGLPPFLHRMNSSMVGSSLIVPMLTAFVPQAYVESSIASIFAPQEVPHGYTDYIGAGLSITRDALRATAHQRVDLKAEVLAMVPLYPGLRIPQEILHGTADTTVFIDVHAEQMIQDTDQARLTALEGIGHTPQHVAHDAVIAAVDRAANRAGLF